MSQPAQKSAPVGGWPEHKTETMKLLQELVGCTLHDTGIGKAF